jgi:uncharacterized protein
MAQEASQMAGPQTGSFCWTEIASSDAEKCKAFYSNVFGWKFKESKATEGAFTYHEFYTDGDYPSGGLYEISREMFGEGEPPPHFLTYVAVDDVDENAKLAVELGGTIIKEPMDIPNTGRFAIIQDPTGAMIATFKMQG